MPLQGKGIEAINEYKSGAIPDFNKPWWFVDNLEVGVYDAYAVPVHLYFISIHTLPYTTPPRFPRILNPCQPPHALIIDRPAVNDSLPLRQGFSVAHS
jgi:hypothetical protein